MKIISSRQNIRIKNFLVLREKSKERKNQNCFVIEGKIEIQRALIGNYKFKTIFICEGFENIFFNYKNQVEEFIIIEKKLFNKISFRSGSEKYLGIGYSKNHDLNNFKLKKNGTYLIAEAIEKPGNIGALIRTSAALGITGFILTDPLTDIYNPLTIRSSLGAIFNQSLTICNSKSLIKLLLDKKINILSTLLNEKSIPYKKAKYSKPCAILVGNESKGLIKSWVSNSNQNINIPMKNNIDSLNVSVAAGILVQHALDN